MLLLLVFVGLAWSEELFVSADTCIPVIDSGTRSKLTAARLVVQKEAAFMASSNVRCWADATPSESTDLVIDLSGRLMRSFTLNRNMTVRSITVVGLKQEQISIIVGATVIVLKSISIPDRGILLVLKRGSLTAERLELGRRAVLSGFGRVDLSEFTAKDDAFIAPGRSFVSNCVRYVLFCFVALFFF